MRVNLLEVTEEAEKNIVYIARVSNPKNQDSPELSKLIKYCITHQHWSIFEHSSMTLEIETSTAIATQLLRHRSFTFQQFSQRYSDPTELGFEPIAWRMKSEKNRQSSLDLSEPELDAKLIDAWQDIRNQILELYKNAINSGIAKECARFILPQCTTTRLYMTGNIRSWIHYIQLRIQPDTQLEHREVALLAQKIFVAELPLTSLALDWCDEKGKLIAN